MMKLLRALLRRSDPSMWANPPELVSGASLVALAADYGVVPFYGETDESLRNSLRREIRRRNEVASPDEARRAQIAAEIELHRGPAPLPKGSIEVDAVHLIRGQENATDIGEALEYRMICEKLRNARDGATVRLIFDNPDFDGSPNCLLEYEADYEAAAERFEGDTMIEALRSAHAAVFGSAAK